MSNVARVGPAAYFLIAGITWLALSIAVLKNPEFYERTMRSGHPRGSDIRWAAILGIVLSTMMLIASLAIATGLVAW